MFLLWALCISTPSLAVTDTFTNPEDSYVRSTSPTMNYGAEMELLADGVSQDPDNGRFGEVVTLVQWDVSSIPAGSTVTSVSVTFNYTDASSGTYNIYSQDTAWTEGSVTWNDLNQGGTLLGTVPPLTFGLGTHVLHASGVALVQGWVDGSIPNNGLIIRTGGTNNGIMMDSKESAGPPPTLEVTYDTVVQNLLERVAFLEDLLSGVTRNGTTLQFEGMNLKIVNGLGATNGNMEDPDSTTGTVNGLGNLIVGYDEKIDPFDGYGQPVISDKSGSHNIVVGHGLNYASFGGLVVGQDNAISGRYSSVSGGRDNMVSGNHSSINGGENNRASGALANSVSGGRDNFANGNWSNVSGGLRNSAYSNYTSISGGLGNSANAAYSSVSGGQNNTANGQMSNVSGGLGRTALGNHDWVAGALFQDN